jgi:hypothetical protein
MEMSLEWKCAITTAIVSVLVYLLLHFVVTSAKVENVGMSIGADGAVWFKSMEVMMLLSVFVGVYANNMLFNACRV